MNKCTWLLKFSFFVGTVLRRGGIWHQFRRESETIQYFERQINRQFQALRAILKRSAVCPVELPCLKEAYDYTNQRLFFVTELLNFCTVQPCHRQRLLDLLTPLRPSKITPPYKCALKTALLLRGFATPPSPYFVTSGRLSDALRFLRRLKHYTLLLAAAFVPFALAAIRLLVPSW